jgi:PAS domain-containing protein
MGNDVLNMREFEQRFRQVFQEAPFAAALVSGPYFIIEMANDACLKLWNRDDTILGMRLLDAMPEIKDQVVFHILEDVYHSGEIFEGKEQEAFLHEDSTWRKLYVNFTYKPIKDDDQTIAGILIIGYDVTDQVINRQKLQESEERTRLAIQAAGLGTFDKDYVSGLTLTSQNLARMFGFEKPVSLEEYVSRIHPDDLPIREAALADALTSGQLFYEVRVVIPDRPVRWVRINGTILFDDANNPIRMIGIGFDISEEKLLKEISNTDHGNAGSWSRLVCRT